MRNKSLFLLFIVFCHTQSWYNHSELVWKTYETEHFIIHFHNGVERTADEAAYIAEAIYHPITEFYNFTPQGKTTIVLRDSDDFSNGTAFYYDNKIEIWAHPLDFDLRGSHRWLQNVITHEFVHIIQIGKSMKLSTRFPAFYMQGFAYEDEKRSDVLYGYPNMMFSVPLPFTAVPPWFAEGTAQYMTPDLSYDYWDSHRDMLLRDLSINEKMLSFNDMNTFGKKGIDAEAVYNQGFLFTEYLVENYGQEILSEISDLLAKRTFSMNSAIYLSTGRTGYELYTEWSDLITNEYKEQLINVFDNLVQGEIIEENGTTNLYPKWSEKGDKIAYISNRDNDYFGQTDLFIYNLEDSSSKKLLSGVKFAPTWINDTTLIFTQKDKPNKVGSRFYNLYRMSLNQSEPDQITKDSRLRSPVYHKSTRQLVALSTIDGTSNIYVSDVDSIDFKNISNFTNQEYISSISWGNNPNLLILDMVLDHGRDIYQFNIDKQIVEKLIDTKTDNRNAVVQDSLIYFAHEHNGVFNIAYQGVDTEIKYITNVPGGAFMPDISSKREIVYSLYSDGGYKIATMNIEGYISEDLVGYDAHVPLDNYHLTNGYQPLEKSSNFDFNMRDYSDEMSDIHIIPRIMLDYGTLKYGIYFFSEEMISRMSILGGASVNDLLDLDLFLLFEYRKFYPTLYSNLYWASRHTEQHFDYYDVNGNLVENIEINNDVDYSLFSADIGIKLPVLNHKVWLNYNYTNYKQKIFQIASQTYDWDEETYTNSSAGKLGFDYLRAHAISLQVMKSQVKPNYMGNMLPNNGYSWDCKLSYEWNSFMNGFSVDDDYGIFGPTFKPNNTYRIEGHYKLYTHFYNKRVLAEFSSDLGFIFNRNVDDFFYFFGGGLPGLKGYTYYEKKLTGPGLIINSITLRSLLIQSPFIKFSDLVVYDKMSLGIIYQGGVVVCDEDISCVDDDEDKTFLSFSNSRFHSKFSSGIELRVSGYIFYGYPSALSLEYHYPLSTTTNPSGKFYLKLLFDF